MRTPKFEREGVKMNCFDKAIGNMDELIESRIAKAKDINLELVTLGKMIKAKLIQSKNEFQLNRHYNGRSYKNEADFYKLKAKSINEQKQILIHEAKKLTCVRDKFEKCKVEMEEEMRLLEEKCKDKDEQLNEIWRNRVVSQKFSNKTS